MILVTFTPMTPMTLVLIRVSRKEVVREVLIILLVRMYFYKVYRESGVIGVMGS